MLRNYALLKAEPGNPITFSLETLKSWALYSAREVVDIWLGAETRSILLTAPK